MSKLKAIKPKDVTPTKPKILIYGKPGVGKTWASLDFPKVYYIDTEGGANLPHYMDKLKQSNGVYMGLDENSLDFETIIEQVQGLATEKHEFKTLVIDSISKVFNAEIAKEQERIQAAGMQDVFGASRKPAVAFMRRLIIWLDRLDMNVILVAHSKSEWGMVGKERVEIGQTFDCWDKLEYELHLCLQIRKQGESRIAKVRKTRLTGFPDAENFIWSYEGFSERYGKDIMEQEAVPLILATTEQITEINKLLDIVKMPDDFIEKCLKKAKIDTLFELDTDQAQSIIKLLTTKKEK